MSKNKKKSPIIIFFICLFALCIISIMLSYWYIFLPILIIASVCIILVLRKKKKTKQLETKQPDNIINSSNPIIDEQKTRKITVDMLKCKVGDDILKYKYDQKMYYTASKIADKSIIGKDIDFVEEPDNEYDSKAIAIHVDGEKLGYVHKGMIQDMLHDWIKKDFAICACISSVSDTEVRYIIGFYKPVETFKCDIFKLTKTSKKIDEYSKRSDNIQFLNEDDEVTFEWDNESESYVVLNNSYNEIGELPQKANDLLDELEDYVAVVDECDTFDSISLKIAIYH